MSRQTKLAVLLAVGAGTLALPAFLDGKQLGIYILAGLAAMVTVGLSLLMGHAGQISLGQASFYAIGAYTAGLLAVHGAPPILGLLAAPVLAAGFATVVGIGVLRLRGHYLAFATLAMQLILLSVLAQSEWAGGAIGLQGIPRLSVGGFEFEEDIQYAYLTWAGLAIVLLVARNLVRSRPGRGLRALATSEVAAASSGVPVGRYVHDVGRAARQLTLHMGWWSRGGGEQSGQECGREQDFHDRPFRQSAGTSPRGRNRTTSTSNNP